MPQIGINISILSHRGVGAPNGDPSGLAVTASSETQADVTCTMNATNATGVSWEYSSDAGINWLVHGTSAAGNYSYTSLTAGTHYSFRCRNYVGTKFSNYSNTATTITFHAELTTYITGLTTPLSAGQKTNLNKFIDDLKVGLNIATLDLAFDVMYLLAGETSESSLRNLISSSYTATLAGATPPGFTAFQGFLSNGTTGYIKTGYNPSTNGVRFTQNSASLGCYPRTNDKSGTQCAIGCNDGTRYTDLLPNVGGSVPYGRMNQASTGPVNPTLTYTYGLITLVRTANNVERLYQHGFGLKQVATASTGVANAELYILADNGNGTPNSFDKRRGSFAFAGKGFTQAEVDVINEAITTYLTANSTCVWTDVWVRKGDLGLGGTTNGEPTVIYDTDPVILTQYTNVFKMWYMVGVVTSSINYAESPTGLPGTWVQYASNPLIANTSRNFVYKYSGTYYLTCAPYPAQTSIKMYSSVDGVSFSLLHDNIITVGGAGTWDSTYVANSCTWVEGTTMYMLYDGYKTGTNIWQTGLATAALADLSAWTKSGSNPVIGGGNTTRGALSVTKVGATYYAWATGSPGTVAVLPSDLYKHSSANLTAWTQSPTGRAFARKIDADGNTSGNGQVSDCTIIEVNNKCYLFYMHSPDQAAFYIAMAIADMTMANLVVNAEEDI